MPIWKPLPGPQQQALESQADILFYGGAAGGGKTDLLLGAALNHKRAIIFRREFVQLSGIIERGDAIYEGRSRYNQKGFWRFNDTNRLIELGSCKDPGDEKKYQGRDHDLKAFDELPHFTEQQFRMLIGWLRSADPTQRCRVICAGNPPMAPEEEWIVQYFAPWLDPTHPNPARPGELRFYAMVNGVETEMPNGEPVFDEKKKRWLKPKSRTFIPASVEDNPYYMASGYMDQLAAMPEPLRSKLLYGDFSAGKEDNPFQVIPSEWVLLAQERWKKREKPTTPITAVGVDVARGGKDKTIITERYDNYFAEQKIYKGHETPDGPSVAAILQPVIKDSSRCRLNIDIIGVGGSVYDCMKPIHSETYAMNGAEGTDARDKTGHLGFLNQRAQWWWQFREALDPESGQEIALPPSRSLYVDLCTPRWKLGARGIQIESKDDIMKRIKRSPDEGDSCVYAHASKWYAGQGLMEYYASEAEKKRLEREENKR